MIGYNSPMRVDLHNHTVLCKHATGTCEEYIQKAIEQNIDVFGFSCHAPMGFEQEYRMSLEQSIQYEKDILILKEKYKNKIDILLAYEVDYMADKRYIESSIIDANIDYLIGSVHFINQWGFDNPEFIGEYKNKDINLIWEEYFNTIIQMARTNYFNIVGHFDLIKVFNFLPNKSILNLAYDALKEIKKYDMVLEINSAGLRKPIKEQYPSFEILKEANKLNIPITFSSDAHSIDHIGFGYNDVIKIAKDAGYNKCAVFRSKQIQFSTF